jgi:ribonuclease HII
MSLKEIGAKVDAAHRVEPFRVLAGIDEAGLGPMLGPLSIGFCALRLPSSDTCVWEALKPVVTRKPESDKRRIVVADSKAVFTRTPRGEKRLELTALAFQALTRESRTPPANGRELLEHGPLGQDPARLDRVPYSTHLPAKLPQTLDAGGLELKIERLARELRRAEIDVLATGTRILPAPELNASFKATDNKSRSHWDACAPALQHLWASFASEGMLAIVDRHGGRMRYGALLEETLDESTVEVVCELESYSEYVVTDGDERGRRMRIAFSEKGDRFSFPVALASCFAKYAREVSMEAFNGYFGSLQPGLKPTAGYYSDGMRWLEEAEEAIGRSGLARDQLVRER